MGQTLIAGLVAGGIYGMLALGIVMVFRGSKVLNFAQAEIGTFACYIAFQVSKEWGLPWLVGAIAAVVVAGAIMAGFEALVVRRMVDAPRLAVAVATIGLLLLLIAVEVKLFGSSPRFLEGPLEGRFVEVLGYRVSGTELIAFFLAAAVGFGLNAFLRRTDFGLGVLAAAQDPAAVRMMGISYARVSQFTWVVAGVLGAVAVLLFEPTVGAFGPGVFSVGVTALFIPSIAAALLGRLTNLTHAFLGGLAVGVLERVVQKLFIGSDIPGVSSVALFVLLVAVLLLRPAELSASEAR